MRSLVLKFVLCFSLLTGTSMASDLEFAPCVNKMSCMQKEGFINALYTLQASFGVVNAICLVAPEPVVTKAVVVLNAGLGVANLILKNVPCEEEGQVSGSQREEILTKVCEMTGGFYDQFTDSCLK